MLLPCPVACLWPAPSAQPCDRSSLPGRQHAAHAHADRHSCCSPGEKAAISRYLHEGRDVRGLPFVKAHLEKVAAVEAYAKEASCSSDVRAAVHCQAGS